MNIEFPIELHELLQVSTMTLATSSPTGEAHAAAVYFAADKSLNLHFFSDTTSQHALDLETNQLAAAEIHPEGADWLKIRGLQIRGTVEETHAGEEWQVGWAAYANKFPFVRDLKFLVQRNQLYTFKPYWLRLIDNRRGFGYKQEWQIG